MTAFHGWDDVLSLLIDLGYLGDDDERSEVFIPNREILDEFRTATRGAEWVGTFEQFAVFHERVKSNMAVMQKVSLNLRYNKVGNMLLASICGNRNGKNDGLEFRHHTCVIERA